jgi:1-phosphofructokinase family hexose kinase
MILIITLNPLLERRFSYKKIHVGEVNRNSVVSYQAGGKGINVSRQLKKLGLKSFNFFFSGGSNGKQFREALKTEGLDFSFINTKTETRHAAIALSEEDKKLTSFFSDNPVIFQDEATEFKIKLEKMIQNCEMVIFSGSSPSLNANSIIPFGIELANKFDKVSVCDTYGENLLDCFNSSPTMIHNNISEIEKSLSIDLSSESLILEFLKNLYQKNIKRSFLTNGKKIFYASNFDYFYKVEPLKVNELDSTGSGDSFVAGLIYSWHHSHIFDESIKFSTALAGINAASFETSKVSLDLAGELKHSVKIFPIGKKIKLIDDSPRQI